MASVCSLLLKASSELLAASGCLGREAKLLVHHSLLHPASLSYDKRPDAEVRIPRYAMENDFRCPFRSCDLVWVERGRGKSLFRSNPLALMSITIIF